MVTKGYRSRTWSTGLGVLLLAGVAASCGAAPEGEQDPEIGLDAPPAVAAPVDAVAPAQSSTDERAEGSAVEQVAQQTEPLIIDPCADINYEDLIDCRSGTCYCFRRTGYTYQWCNWWFRQVSVWETYVC